MLNKAPTSTHNLKKDVPHFQHQHLHHQHAGSNVLNEEKPLSSRAKDKDNVHKNFHGESAQKKITDRLIQSLSEKKQQLNFNAQVPLDRQGRKKNSNILEQVRLSNFVSPMGK
eukprot:TRINITY_DN62682_c0_g2_i1.p1 TRINITY_DN62682_c0_g2~~TRINITY_DN62682_c0_g2_i1.p1  ORF type:complete len:113 (+),score=14.32 TRINITY_DN62682_c0_g2_i1:178-516(+)